MSAGAWNSVADAIEFTADVDITSLRERVAPTARVLEIGCGYGRVLKELQEAGFDHLAGCDASQRMISRAKREGVPAALSIADARNLPYPAGSMDVVLMVALLTSMPEASDREAAVIEALRILGPGGLVHGVEFLREPGHAYDEDGRLRVGDLELKHFDPEELRAHWGAGTWEQAGVPMQSLSGKRVPGLQYFFQPRGA